MELPGEQALTGQATGIDAGRTPPGGSHGQRDRTLSAGDVVHVRASSDSRSGRGGGTICP